MVLLPCTEGGIQCGYVQSTVQISSGNKIFRFTKAERILGSV